MQYQLYYFKLIKELTKKTEISHRIMLYKEMKKEKEIDLLIHNSKQEIPRITNSIVH